MCVCIWTYRVSSYMEDHVECAYVLLHWCLNMLSIQCIGQICCLSSAPMACEFERNSSLYHVGLINACDAEWPERSILRGL